MCIKLKLKCSEIWKYKFRNPNHDKITVYYDPINYIHICLCVERVFYIDDTYVVI